MKLNKNMNSVDQIVRVIIAVVLGVLYFTGVISGTWGLVGLIVAVVFILTSVFSWCPIYAALGLSTRK
jgi:hypothetical protein